MSTLIDALPEAQKKLICELYAWEYGTRESDGRSRASDVLVASIGAAIPPTSSLVPKHFWRTVSPVPRYLVDAFLKYPHEIGDADYTALEKLVLVQKTAVRAPTAGFWAFGEDILKVVFRENADTQKAVARIKFRGLSWTIRGGHPNGPYRAHSLTKEGVAVAQALLSRSGGEAERRRSADGIASEAAPETQRDFRSADWFSFEHGIPQSRLSEAATEGKVRTMNAPPGTLGPEGQKLRRLYHVADALKYCAPKYVKQTTRRKRST